MLARRVLFAGASLGFALLGACSSPNAPAPPQNAAAPVKPAADPRAAKSIEMYRQLLQSKSYELAGPIGQEIVQNYPNSPEANEVRETLPDTVAKGTAITTRRRLERLWIYQQGKESGGDQVTASIYSSQPSNEGRVRLVLRRHSAWGQSAYLFGDGKGFECAKSNCTVTAKFDDGAPQKLKAHLPETGEPAIFISDDRAFIAKMAKSQTISFDVLEKGKGAQTLVFEVGGYDADKFGVPAKTSKK